MNHFHSVRCCEKHPIDEFVLIFGNITKLKIKSMKVVENKAESIGSKRVGRRRHSLQWPGDQYCSYQSTRGSENHIFPSGKC